MLATTRVQVRAGLTVATVAVAAQAFKGKLSAWAEHPKPGTMPGFNGWHPAIQHVTAARISQSSRCLCAASKPGQRHHLGCVLSGKPLVCARGCMNGDSVQAEFHQQCQIRLSSRRNPGARVARVVGRPSALQRLRRHLCRMYRYQRDIFVAVNHSGRAFAT
jgi:hypothetical protein